MLTTATRVPHHALLKGRRALLDVGHSHVLRKQIAYDERLIRQRWSAGYRSHTTTTVAHDVARQPGVSSVAASNEPSWKSTARFAGAVVVAATAAAAGAAAVGSLFKADDDRVVSATATQLSSALCLTPVPKGVGCAYRRRIQDMYRLVDNPVGQGIEAKRHGLTFALGQLNTDFRHDVWHMVVLSEQYSSQYNRNSTLRVAYLSSWNRP